MKLTTGILMLGLTVGAAWAQNPDVIQNTRDTLNNVQKKQTNDENAALAVSGQTPSTPAPAKAAPAKAAPAKSAPATTGSPASKPAASASSKPTPVTPAAKSSKPPVISVTPAKPVSAPAAKEKAAKASKLAATKPAETKPVEAKKDKEEAKAAPVAVEDKKTPVEPKKEEKTYSSIGKRDPFVSPVVSRSISGSGCSSGKRCLAIDQIALTGIVKSDSGMIAVVVNALNKAYFLRENDPVFNGYVVKITGDSIIFKETIQDKLGKPFEREVTKKINTPAV